MSKVPLFHAVKARLILSAFTALGSISFALVFIGIILDAFKVWNNGRYLAMISSLFGVASLGYFILYERKELS